MYIMIKSYIKTTPSFDRKAKETFTEEALKDLLDFLEEHPESGKIITGTGGVRKLRWSTGKNDRGKSGGARVLYHYSKNVLVLLITLYSKTEKEDITDKERNELKKTVPLLVEKYKEAL